MRRVLVAAAALATAGCQKQVDSRSFEQEIAARMTTLGLPPATVTCPGDVALAKGTQFRCTVVTAGHSYDLDATVGEPLEHGSADVQIDTKWAGGEAIVASKLETAMSPELTKALAGEARVSCGEPLRFLAADRTLTCDLSISTQKVKLVTTFDAKDVPTSWRIDPPMLARVGLEKVLTPLVAAQVPGASVACGAQALVPRPADGKVGCDVTAGSDHARLAVTVDDQQNVTHWEVVK